MRILSIGGDESVFRQDSPARLRQEAYAQAFGFLEIIALSKRPHDGYAGEHLAISAAYAASPLARLWRARNIARRLPKPDVVTAQDPFEIGLMAFLVTRKSGAPLHVQVHTDLLSPEFARHSFLNRIRARIAGFVLKRAARIRVVSERVKHSIEEKYRPRAPITVLPIFVDLERFANAQAPDVLAAKFGKFKTRLLVVARLEPEKNVELAVRSFAAAPEDACLIVVGEGGARKRLQALSRALHVSDRVFFEGAQDPAPYYALADLLLVTSKYEGYGLVIVEALAAGTPVLSTDIGVAREAGAIVSNEANFAEDLRKWLASGPREGTLKAYPYRNFEEYVRAYRDDIAACAKAH